MTIRRLKNGKEKKYYKVAFQLKPENIQSLYIKGYVPLVQLGRTKENWCITLYMFVQFFHRDDISFDSTFSFWSIALTFSLQTNVHISINLCLTFIL